MENPIKKYQVWTYQGHGSYTLEVYDTLKECISVNNYGQPQIITQKVNWKIVEKKA